MSVTVDLEILEGEYAISLLPVDDPIPDWLPNRPESAEFTNISRGDDELSIVCRSGRVPSGVQTDAGWVAMKLSGSFDFDETGVVLSVVRPLSENGLGVFVVSTFHRDYLLVKRTDMSEAQTALRDSGHRIKAG